MAARFEPGGDDGVDAGVLQRHRFLRRGGGPQGEDAARTTGGHDRRRGDTENEADDRDPLVDQGGDLVLETDRGVGGIRRTCDPQFREVGGQRLEAPPEGRLRLDSGRRFAWQFCVLKVRMAIAGGNYIR